MTYDYDRLRWFLFVQDKMTKDQLVSFAKSKGIHGRTSTNYSNSNVDFNAKQEVLLNQINSYLRLQEHEKWKEIQRTTEALWKNGWLNYDPEWTPIEPNWEQYSHPTLTINGSNNIEDDDFYKLLMSMEAINEERKKGISPLPPPTSEELISFGLMKIYGIAFVLSCIVFGFYFVFKAYTYVIGLF